jgi:hypothetical protein
MKNQNMIKRISDAFKTKTVQGPHFPVLPTRSKESDLSPVNPPVLSDANLLLLDKFVNNQFVAHMDQMPYVGMPVFVTMISLETYDKKETIAVEVADIRELFDHDLLTKIPLQTQCAREAFLAPFDAADRQKLEIIFTDPECPSTLFLATKKAALALEFWQPQLASLKEKLQSEAIFMEGSLIPLMK